MAIEILHREKNNKKQPTRYFSSKQEKQVAKNLGGQTTPGSGSTPWIKGDLLLEDWLIECKTKTTHADSISIKREWFDKNDQEKSFMGKKYSAIAFSFGPNEENRYIIDEYLFQELLEYLKNKTC